MDTDLYIYRSVSQPACSAQWWEKCTGQYPRGSTGRGVLTFGTDHTDERFWDLNHVDLIEFRGTPIESPAESQTAEIKNANVECNLSRQNSVVPAGRRQLAFQIRRI